jgi:hypothetical protein
MRFSNGSNRDWKQFDYLPFIEVYRHSHFPDEDYRYHYHVVFQWLYWYGELQIGKD